MIALLVECLYLGSGGADQLREIAQQLHGMRTDPRLACTTMVAKAMIAHRIGHCGGACRDAYAALAERRSHGAAYVAECGELPLAVLAIDHGIDEGLKAVRRAVMEARFPVPAHARWWLRRVAPHAVRTADDLGPDLLIRLLELDRDFWLPHAGSALSALSGPARRQLLDAIAASSGPDTTEVLRGVDGADVQELRRTLIQRHAPRVYIRSFGALAIHRGAWDCPASAIGRRRIRLLLGLLVANYESGLTRDQALDILWPDADPASAVNSLNQTVFQLRRLIEPNYREGESPQYVISNVDSVQLNEELVVTDLAAIRRLRAEAGKPSDSATRAKLAHELVDLVRGEFLADLKYEDWASQAQMSVHSEVRSALLPIARGEVVEEGDEWAFKAGCSLVALDPYDEDAHVAMIRHLSASGRRKQARTLASGFAERLRAELDEEPSEQLAVAARLAGTTV
jgi:DNA-binding SARP family transcriptional activator